MILYTTDLYTSFNVELPLELTKQITWNHIIISYNI